MLKLQHKINSQALITGIIKLQLHPVYKKYNHPKILQTSSTTQHKALFIRICIFMFHPN